MILMKLIIKLYLIRLIIIVPVFLKKYAKNIYRGYLRNNTKISNRFIITLDKLDESKKDTRLIYPWKIYTKIKMQYSKNIILLHFTIFLIVWYPTCRRWYYEKGKIAVVLDPEVRKKVKIKAVERDVPVSEVVEECLRKMIEREELEEDIALTKFAEEREKSFSEKESLTHDEVWG